MRVLVLLLFVCFLLWGVAYFTGDRGGAAATPADGVALLEDELGSPGEAPLGRPSDGSGADLGQPQAAGAGGVSAGRFLAQPAAPEGVLEPELESAASAPEDDLAWLGEPATPVRGDRVQLAGALLHTGPDEMREVLRAEADAERVTSDEIRLYLAFTEAMSGKVSDARERARGIEDPDGVDSRELACLKAALDSAPSPIPASFSAERLVGLAMTLRLTAREAERALQAGQHARAAGLLTEVLVGELEGPWTSDRVSLSRWTDLLREAQSHHRLDPQGDWPSVDIEVRSGDSLTAVRMRAIEARPGLVVNTGLINQVNRIGERYLQPGEIVRVPTEPVSSLVDLSARWVLVFFGDEVAAAYECGIGAAESPTILGDFFIGTKKENPPWFQVGREPVPFGDPENPLGTRWLGWHNDAGKTSYGFHGTWEPETIGTASSMGCVRLRNAEVEQLHELLPRRSTVTVRR